MVYKQLYATNDYSNIDKIIENCKLNFAELIRIDSAQPKDAILYRYFRVQYADSYIYYQVTKIIKNTCVIMVCQGINLDEWDEGSRIVELGYAKEMIKQRLQLEKLFGKK